jgi:hypothetical protein
MKRARLMLGTSIQKRWQLQNPESPLMRHFHGRDPDDVSALVVYAAWKKLDPGPSFISFGTMDHALRLSGLKGVGHRDTITFDLGNGAAELITRDYVQRWAKGETEASHPVDLMQRALVYFDQVEEKLS